MMQITIDNGLLYDKKFIYKYLPKYINNLVLSSCNKKILSKIDKEFNIDSIKIIKFAMKNIKIELWNSSYIISIDNTKLYKGKNINKLLNIILMGNRSCKGYRLIYDVFKFIQDYIDFIYSEWEK